ncbi:MAG TPA: class I SAM-dependent RNA methyltransferase [Verrucomicrobiales bacterium]|nr:class I SAM-dependent RNA methyltransferase [Verrucomicrobiales bacterium]
MNSAPRPPRKFHPHPFAYHQEIELEITTLTNMGQGLGRVDGWVVMVPFALPGELIRARVYRNDKNFSEADLVSVLRPSPDRVEPRCVLFGECGGCQYQHLAYPEQLAWKRRQVEELLRHMAKVEFEVAPVIASPQEYAYRSKITPHFDAGGDGVPAEIGFLRAGRRKELVDVPRCEIATEAINAVLEQERAAIRSRRWKRGATLLLRDATIAGKHTVLTDPSSPALTEVGGLTFEFLAGDFFQNNPFILESFVTYAVQQAKRSGARFLVDAYCGSGLFSLFGAREFETVTGIEISATAVDRARGNAARNGLANCSFTAGSAEAIFENITLPPEETAVIIDPPRRGSDEVFLTQLFAFGPRSVVYVSCNPATQMRDLRLLLDAGYVLKAVQPFDLFPQTKHLECVISMEKA